MILIQYERFGNVIVVRSWWFGLGGVAAVRPFYGRKELPVVYSRYLFGFWFVTVCVVRCCCCGGWWLCVYCWCCQQRRGSWILWLFISMQIASSICIRCCMVRRNAHQLPPSFINLLHNFLLQILSTLNQLFVRLWILKPRHTCQCSHHCVVTWSRVWGGDATIVVVDDVE